MATELEELGRRLRASGFREGGSVVSALGRSLHGARLVPRRLPDEGGERDRHAPFRTRRALLDVGRLRERREARQFSQRGLSLAARLSSSYVSNVEARGAALPVMWATAAALADALGVPVEELLAPGGDA